MKRKICLLLTIAGVLTALSGCGSQPEEEREERPWPETVVMSNLADEEARGIAEQLLSGIAGEEQIQVFFDHVDQINGYLEPEELTDGFEEVSITQPKYDPYQVQERWDTENLEFPGYNCRITAFSLFRDQMIFPQESVPGSPDYVMMDLISLDADPSAIPDEAGRTQFETLYTGVDTENTKDISVHLAKLQEAWQERGISFKEGSASLISVVFHDQIDEDRLFVGHTGILFETEEGELFFLEKLAFQEPYQLVKVADRGALSDYLMAKYDVEFNQPTAAPFVMENAELIEGYRDRGTN